MPPQPLLFILNSAACIPCPAFSNLVSSKRKQPQHKLKSTSPCLIRLCTSIAECGWEKHFKFMTSNIRWLIMLPGRPNFSSIHLLTLFSLSQTSSPILSLSWRTVFHFTEKPYATLPVCSDPLLVPQMNCPKAGPSTCELETIFSFLT